MWVSKKYVEMLEKELEYYRVLAERERARADRLHDQLLQDRGCLPATETTIVAQEKAQQKVDEELEKQREQLTEIYAEAIEEHKDAIDDAEESDLVQSLSEDVRQMLRPIK